MKRGVIVVIAVAVLAGWAVPAPGQEVVARARLGNHQEDVTFVSSGPLANHIAYIDGYEVYGLPAGGLNEAAPRKLFDLHGLPFQLVPRGLAWVDSAGAFYFDDARQPATLILSDFKGKLVGTRPITYLGGYAPYHLEGLVYIPREAAAFADHLAMVAWDDAAGVSRVEIMRPDGQVVLEIPAPPGVSVTSIGFQSPDSLLVHSLPVAGLPVVWCYNLSLGAWTGSKELQGPTSGFEGLVEGRKGTVAAVGGSDGIVRIYDAALEPLARYDRSLTLGPGISPTAIAWDANAGSMLVRQTISSNTGRILRLNAAMSTATSFLEPQLSYPYLLRMTAMPAEHLVAVAAPTMAGGLKSQLLLVNEDDGSIAGTVPLSSPYPGSYAALVRYVPATDTFLIGFSGTSARNKLFEVSREGALIRVIDLGPVAGSGAIGGFAVFQTASGETRLMLLTTPATTHELIVTDLTATVLSRFDYRTMDEITAYDVEAITSGPWAGAFCLSDNEGNELTIFRLR